MRVGVGRLSAPTRPSSSQRFSMNLWLPSPWIAPSFGRTDHSLLRTGRDTYRIIRRSGFLVSLTLADSHGRHHDIHYTMLCSSVYSSSLLAYTAVSPVCP